MAAKARFETDHTDWKGARCENKGIAAMSNVRFQMKIYKKVRNCERKHPNRPPPPIIRVVHLDLHPVFPSLDLKSPPVLFADRDVAPGTEKQRYICEEGSENCDPNPGVLTSILFCFVLVADPTPKLSINHDKCETSRNDISEGLTPTGCS